VREGESWDWEEEEEGGAEMKSEAEERVRANSLITLEVRIIPTDLS